MVPFMVAPSCCGQITKTYHHSLLLQLTGLEEESNLWAAFGQNGKHHLDLFFLFGQRLARARFLSTFVLAFCSYTIPMAWFSLC